ncbi:hypothetical protein EN788_34445 [Mesorhizobium sp. M2D.F.Ca.ET.145.01.1.1]|nr:hypothetical protein EN788_34445 [Mesorhizobium sp. M2D.F.Ca.ET.145.01.1.1]
MRADIGLPSGRRIVGVEEHDRDAGRLCRFHLLGPHVEYCLTDWGQALCPALDALLKWAAQKGSADA